jgi:hypothetical protein
MEGLTDHFEDLATKHGRFIDNFMPESSDSPTDTILGTMYGPPRPLTPPSSVSTSVPSPAPSGWTAQSFAIKPQFNFDSAEKLLQSFNRMLGRFPCIVLPDNASVSSLASGNPFILLAILAASSGKESLQGHSLYDEEFRKIFSLKFVAGGERSLELLLGLLIYLAW